MVNREVRWNMKTDTGEQERQKHRYLVAITNTPSEIDNIREKMLAELAVAGELREVCDYQISGSNGLHCKVIEFFSERGRITHPERIYLGRFRRDRDLIPRAEEDMLTYIERVILPG